MHQKSLLYMQFKPIIAENNVEIAICSQIFSMTIKLRKFNRTNGPFFIGLAIIRCFIMQLQHGNREKMNIEFTSISKELNEIYFL